MTDVERVQKCVDEIKDRIFGPLLDLFRAELKVGENKRDGGITIVFGFVLAQAVDDEKSRCIMVPSSDFFGESGRVVPGMCSLEERCELILRRQAASALTMLYEGAYLENKRIRDGGGTYARNKHIAYTENKKALQDLKDSGVELRDIIDFDSHYPETREKDIESALKGL